MERVLSTFVGSVGSRVARSTLTAKKRNGSVPVVCMVKLFAHQQALLDLNPPRHLIAFGTGCGKSLIGVELAKKNNVTPLVICPKGIVKQWQGHVISKETFRRDWDKLPKYEAVIVDEAHAFANLKSQLSKALIKYCRKHNVQYRWLLTATPLTKDANSIFALATHLGYKWHWPSFHQKFFSDVRMGARIVPVQKKGMEGELIKLIKSIGTVAKLEDLVDLPPQTFATEYFEQTPEQEKAIAELQETDYIARFTKTSTIENGFYYGNEYEPADKTYPCAKTERVVQLCEDNDKIIIVCRYNAQIAYYQERLAGLGKTIFVINGKTKDRHQSIQEAESLPEAIILAQGETMEGWEAPSFRVMVFASLSFKYLAFTQAVGRISRINNPKPNYYLTLLTRGEADEAIFEAISQKRDFYVQLNQ